MWKNFLTKYLVFLNMFKTELNVVCSGFRFITARTNSLTPVSSTYIWSKNLAISYPEPLYSNGSGYEIENLVAESETKDGGIWRAYSTSPQSFLLFSLRGQHKFPTKLRQEWAAISCFLYNLYNNILVLWTDNLVNDVMLVQKLYLAGQLVLKLCTTLKAIVRQFDLYVRHVWLHFFAWTNDWSSYSRYIWSSLPYSRYATRP